MHTSRYRGYNSLPYVNNNINNNKIACHSSHKEPPNPESKVHGKEHIAREQVHRAQTKTNCCYM